MQENQVFENIYVFGLNNIVALVLETKDGNFPTAVWLTYNKADKLIGDLRTAVKEHKKEIENV